MSADIQIVDENDQPTGQAKKQEAWSKGLWHRAVRIMLINDSGELLLQHRSADKDIFPNCWDNSAAGHVDAGEDYDTAAKRELAEELGIRELELQPIGYFKSSEVWQGHKFNRFAKIYIAKSNDTPAQLEAGKIDAVRWFTLERTKQMVAEHPDQVSDGLRQVIERYSTELANSLD